MLYLILLYLFFAMFFMGKASSGGARYGGRKNPMPPEHLRPKNKKL